LAFLNRSEGGDDDIKILDTGKILRWLVSRQIKVDDSDNDDDDENNNDNDDAYNDQKYPNINDNKSNVQQNKPNTVNQVNHVTNTDTQDSKMERSVERSIEWSGMNGRCNKDADTCYAFWTGAALAVSLSLPIHPQQRLNIIEDLKPVTTNSPTITDEMAFGKSRSSLHGWIWEIPR